MVGTINEKNMFSVLNEEQETQVTQELEQNTQATEEIEQETQVTQEVKQTTRSTFKGREVVPLVRKAIQKCRKEAESHSVTKQPTPTNTPVQTSTTPTKFMVATSYLEQNRPPMRHQQTATRPNNDGSYPTVDSKCTKACTRALLQENGRYGVCTKPSCTFAHSLDELRDTMCRFDASCRTINGTRRNDWTIDTSNVCKYRHSIESKEAWFRRTGQSIPALPQTKMCKEEPLQTVEGSEQTPLKTLELLSQQFRNTENVEQRPLQTVDLPPKGAEQTPSETIQLLIQEFKNTRRPTEQTPLQQVDLPTEPVIDESTHTYDWNIHRPVEFYNQTFRTQAPSEYTYGDSIHRDSVVHKRDRSLSPDHRSHTRSVHVITVPTKELAEIAVKSLIDREIYNFKIVLG